MIARFDLSVANLPPRLRAPMNKLFSRWLPCATLRAGEGLVGAGGDPGCALGPGVLELLADQEAEDVGGIVEDRNVLRLADLAELSQGLGEEEEAALEAARQDGDLLAVPVAAELFLEALRHEDPVLRVERVDGVTGEHRLHPRCLCVPCPCCRS